MPISQLSMPNVLCRQSDADKYAKLDAMKGGHGSCQIVRGLAHMCTRTSSWLRISMHMENMGGATLSRRVFLILFAKWVLHRFRFSSAAICVGAQLMSPLQCTDMLPLFTSKPSQLGSVPLFINLPFKNELHEVR